MPNAIVTGASRGLGLALSRALHDRGFGLVVDARGGAALERAWAGVEGVVALEGDVADPWHRSALSVAAGDRVDVLVNNASLLGPSPQPALRDYPLDELRRVYEVNAVAPLALVQAVRPKLAPRAVIVNVTSDAAEEPYAGWGGYGSSKAALEQWTRILAAEHPDWRVYAVDPGDMRTQMHQDAFPGEDISDRPEPATVVPALRRLLAERPPSGRVRASELLVGAA